MKKKLLLIAALMGGITAFGQFCTPTYTYACSSGDFINSVALNTINNTSTGCANSGPNYSDYTAMSTTLTQNTTYPITYSPGPSWGQYFIAGIDFNNDGDFADAGEFYDLGYVASGGTGTGSIAIPNGIPGGPTTFRVVCSFGTGVLTQADLCGAISWGETEDYTVVIPPPLTDDAGITSFVTPSLPTCNFSDSVRVELSNWGTSPLTSAVINWEWNGVPQSPVSWSGNLASFGSTNVTLGLVALATGDNLLAYSSMPNGLVESPAGSWNDSSTIANISAGLSGNYTVGGATPDFADVNAALADLTTFGICGPVVFDIRDGLYTGALDLPSLASMSAANTVTFRSENGDASLVSLEYAGTNGTNYVVNMNNVHNFHFENLTLKNTGTGYGTVVKMNGSSMNSFKSCHLISPTTTSTSTDVAVLYSSAGLDTNNLFMNSVFENGSYGSYWYGVAAGTPEHGNVFEGNTYKNNYYRGGMYYYNEGLVVKNNEYMSTAGVGGYLYGRYAIYAYYATGAPQITGNVVKGSTNTGWTYGVYVSQGGGNNAEHALIANNMVQTGYPGNTNYNYGIYLTDAGYIDVYHNTSLTTVGGVGSRAFYANYGGGIEVLNNVFANYGSGYALYAGNNFTVSNSDYNVLYAPSGNAGYFGSDQATLADWQNASAFDANSIDYNPNFFSNYDLHVCSDSIGNQGVSIPSIMMDIDGHPRSATSPDMGADEFNGLNGSFLGSDAVFCTGDSVQLWAGSPSDTILWSTGETTSSIWVSSPGSYTVVVQSACGSGSDAIVVTASAANYTGYMAASDVSFCNGDSVLLYSTQAADSYSWSGGSTNDSLYVTTGGTYTLDIQDGCGTGSEALTITMNDVPVATYSHTTNYLASVFTNTTNAGPNATYLWSFGDGATSLIENPTHSYANSGKYVATLTVTNDCGSATFSDTINLFVAGIEEVADFGTINVSPNPSAGMFNVNLELNEVMNLNMVVTNVMGQVVSTKAIDAASGTESTQIDLSTEAAGVYYLNILSGDKKLTNKMLIKK